MLSVQSNGAVGVCFTGRGAPSESALALTSAPSTLGDLLALVDIQASTAADMAASAYNLALDVRNVLGVASADHRQTKIAAADLGVACRDNAAAWHAVRDFLASIIEGVSINREAARTDIDRASELQLSRAVNATMSDRSHAQNITRAQGGKGRRKGGRRSGHAL